MNSPKDDAAVPTGNAPAAHTTGPWEVYHVSALPTGLSGLMEVTRIGPFHVMADCMNLRREASETTDLAMCEADARLIAAAPTLIDELQKAHAIITVLLNLVPDERKFAMAEKLAKVHDGEGAVRYHERAAVIRKALGKEA